MRVTGNQDPPPYYPRLETLTVTVMAFGPMSPADWRKAHAMWGNDHPGRFKDWAWKSGYLFGPMGPRDAEGVRGLLRGLQIPHEIETTQRWEPAVNVAAVAR